VLTAPEILPQFGPAVLNFKRICGVGPANYLDAAEIRAVAFSDIPDHSTSFGCKFLANPARGLSPKGAHMWKERSARPLYIKKG